MSADLEIIPLLTLAIRDEPDIVACRQHARQFAAAMGFDLQSQTRIATAVSEIARNAFQYAGGGVAEFRAESNASGARRYELRQQGLTAVIRDTGPGIQNLDAILAGDYRSKTGMGQGLVGARRLMDTVDIQTNSAGSIVTLRKNLPPTVLRKSSADLRALAEIPASPQPANVIVEVQRQNQELLSIMEEVRQRQEELSQVNKELEETNAGVLALYDELETLHRVGLLLASKVDLQAVMQALSEATTDLTNAEFGACFLQSDSSSNWERYAEAGPKKDALQHMPSTQPADLFGSDFGADGLIHIADLLAEEAPSRASRFAEALLPRMQLRSCLAVPLVSAENQVLGALVFGSSEPGIFSERSERIVGSISTQAIVAIDKARLFDSVKAASAAKDKFLAMISHELRTPLNPVLSIVSSLHKDPALPQAMREDVAVVLRNVQLEARLIDDLLDFHRIIKGNLDFASEAADVHAVIQNVIEICDADIRANRHALQLHLNAPRAVVLGDQARLQQVLWNIVKNSIKFTPRGGAISITTSVEGSDNLRIDVEDNGRGIEPHLLQNIFNAFDQGSVEGLTQFGGLGLGLAIVKAFVEKHGGSVVAESSGRDQGTTIILRLPLAGVDVTSLSEPPETAPPDRMAGKILLIDDHMDTLWSLSRLLTRTGYTVVTAMTCSQGLELSREQEFDVIISDLGLPDGSGLELIRKIRAQSSTPAIALSGYGMDTDVLESKAAGFDMHLTKPVAFQQLSHSIEWLRQQAPRS